MGEDIVHTAEQFERKIFWTKNKKHEKINDAFDYLPDVRNMVMYRWDDWTG